MKKSERACWRLNQNNEARGLMRPLKLQQWLRAGSKRFSPLKIEPELVGMERQASSQSSFFALDRRVTELAFEGETLWAYFR